MVDTVSLPVIRPCIVRTGIVLCIVLHEHHLQMLPPQQLVVPVPNRSCSETLRGTRNRRERTEMTHEHIDHPAADGKKES